MTAATSLRPRVRIQVDGAPDDVAGIVGRIAKAAVEAIVEPSNERVALSTPARSRKGKA
jgi:hypothetical protein